MRNPIGLHVRTSVSVALSLLAILATGVWPRIGIASEVAVAYAYDIHPVTAFVPTSDEVLSTPWTSIGFDDQAWSPGFMGVGYAGPGDRIYFDNLRLSLYDQMHSKSPSALIRVPFTNSYTFDVDSLQLEMLYDDGVIAYLNGVEVLRVGFGVPTALIPAWDSLSGNRPEPADFEVFDITSHKSLLRQGDNVLALRGFNNSFASQDFIVKARLIGYVPEPSATLLLALAGGVGAGIFRRGVARSSSNVLPE